MITGDASISLDELGVPISISKNLTYPEVVTPHNRDWLQGLVRRRAFKRIVRDAGSEVRSYFKVTGDFQLEVGDTVERHLIDGDVVLFNRQPSLHKVGSRDAAAPTRVPGHHNGHSLPLPHADVDDGPPRQGAPLLDIPSEPVGHYALQRRL